METAKRKKVIVGMSGGVDSSVAAALLLKDGRYEVTGAFMKNWSDTKDEVTGRCAWRQERADAQAVADRLGIELKTFDMEYEYRERVIGYMLAEYGAGRTPNPDVLCNREIKFGTFLKLALADGADLVATGHYARVRDGADGPELLAGLDGNKDQSYFLHQLSRDQLSRALFPVGELRKPAVRALARELGLPVADKKDSVGVCFVGEVDMPEFLRARVAGRPGPVVTVDGHVVGRHPSLVPYTIGQRHGLGIGGGETYFVVEKDVRRNALVVAAGDDPAELYSREVEVTEPHWIGEPPRAPFSCMARLRYRQPLQPCSVEPQGDRLTLRFDEPQRAVAPGQFAVLYDGDLCLGGGTIAGAS